MRTNQVFGLRAAWAALILTLTLTAADAATPPQRGASEVRPNVLFVLVDDLDESVLQSGLSAGLYPHIQQLMGTATTFANSFVSLSMCCPSRATYLTGLYGHNHGTIRNDGPSGGFKSFRDSSTLAVWLQAGGYRTALMGKYFNGYTDEAAAYTPPGWSTWNALFDMAMYDYTMTTATGPRTYGSAPADYQTDVYADLADAFVRTPSEQPFYLALNPQAPHLEGDDDAPDGTNIRPAPRHEGTPSVALPARALASFNESDMSDKPAWLRTKPKVDALRQELVFNHKRAAMRAVDDMVGKLVATLVELGKWENTLFVFASDNGFQYGTHRRNLTKVDLYEESIRVPLIIKAPGQTSGGVSAAWVVNNDWAPTVMDYAGLTRTDDIAFDGRSLRPWVAAPDLGGGRRTILVELPADGRERAHPPFYAVRSKDPALTQDATGSKVIVYAATLEKTGNRMTDEEHYDLSTDPYQLKSLHRSKVAVRVQQRQLMRARMRALAACTGEACKALED